MNDQDRISPQNIKTISSRQVVKIKENINLELISPCYQKNCTVDSKENC